MLEDSPLIYPNPTTNFLWLRASDPSSHLSVEISDLVGKKILEATMVKDVPIDVSSLKPGWYLIQISSPEWKEQFKFIKQQK